MSPSSQKSRGSCWFPPRMWSAFISTHTWRFCFFTHTSCAVGNLQTLQYPVYPTESIHLQHEYYWLKLRLLSISLGFFPFLFGDGGWYPNTESTTRILLKLRLLPISLEFFPFFVWRSWARVHPPESLNPKDLPVNFFMLLPLVWGQLGQTNHTAWYQWHLSLFGKTSVTFSSASMWNLFKKRWAEVP